MLEVRDLAVNYSGIQAVRGVSLDIAEGEMVALIGANGAGKSSLINALSGVVRAASGTVTFEGAEIQRMSPWSISARGLIQVPEGRLVFSALSVEENLLLGATAAKGRKAQFGLAEVYDLFPILKERRNQLAGSLSGGQQQMLAIGRGLMSGPRLLLLDEPSLGLAPVIVSQVFRALMELRAQGLTTLLVEQNANLALSVSDRAYMMEQGRIVHQGPSRQMAEDPDIIALYMGQTA
ncbi:ATP-binding cassette domain-containing protein [Rhodobacterales bacterium HKCCE2091]|nr:ATP-binding cassette domain-containing protein [Rhodobacterales bacterium HKCCE2091]